jgi:WhiB family redox-sensing transcriptional regulator
MSVMDVTATGLRTGWLEQAACQHHDPDLFFPVSEVGPGVAQIDDAKRVCRSCPVIAECLEWAVARAIPFGVWGGLSGDERELIARTSRADRRP